MGDYMDMEDFTRKQNEQKMITSQECLQMKRDLEDEGRSDFELSPMVLCMMITFLIFGIGCWFWLIFWSCLFEKPIGNAGKKKDKSARVPGGKSNKSKNEEGSSTERNHNDSSRVSVQSQRLKNYNPITCHEIPDFDHILQPAEESQPGSYRQAGTTSSPTSPTKVQECSEAESRKVYGSTVTSLEKEGSGPSKKYKIQWTKLFKLGCRDDSKN